MLLTVREIATDADAAAASFRGSPSFIIDGTDLFPSNAAPALACRVYADPRGFSGQPDLESLRNAIRGVGLRDRLRAGPKTESSGSGQSGRPSSPWVFAVDSRT
ncbi:hypothetical protein AHiyo6_13930 [Arthrobacter sp. Hiyo6]|nr:hypothetical protein AHiyo6_13930 [Arthrobacter sp. Hiyo6]